MASVYRRSYKTTDKSGREVRRKCKRYTIKYTDSKGIVRKVRGYSDKRASEQLAARLDLEAARGAEHMEDAFKDSYRKPITQHLADYVADLEAAGRSEKHCYNARMMLAKLFNECEWRLFTDINPEAFTNWRAKRKGKLAPRTLNSYYEHIRAFLNWGVKQHRFANNPLAGVVKVDARGKEERKRRALSLQELDALLSVADDRALCYKTTLYCQLRRADVEALRWADVNLDVLNPYLVTRAESSKGKRTTRHPLRADLAGELRAFRPADARMSDPVFPDVPSIDAYKADLKRAGIEYKDELGRQADFHALGRMTPNTMLATAGVAPRTAQELMRHTDIQLTMGPYIDPGMLQKLEAVESLPVVGEGRHLKRDEAKILKATGTNDADSLNQKCAQTIDITQSGRTNAPSGARGTIGTTRGQYDSKRTCQQSPVTDYDERTTDDVLVSAGSAMVGVDSSPGEGVDNKRRTPRVGLEPTT